MTHSSDKHKLWFTRRDGVVRGPYPTLMIRRYVLLGRLQEQDEVSQDREIWHPLMAYPELIPDEFSDLDTPEGQERLRLARLREDERAKERRQQFESDRTDSDRRDAESLDVILHREHRTDLLAQRSAAARIKGLWPLWVVVGIAAILSVSLLFWHPPRPMLTPPDCAAPPSPGINWNHCGKAGARLNGALLDDASMNNTDFLGASMVGASLNRADLSYADLRRTNLERAQLGNARMLGAVLQGANLQSANLSAANLSYADLRNANLQNANLSDANLDRTIWIDGRICNMGSRGQCVTSTEESQ